MRDTGAAVRAVCAIPVIDGLDSTFLARRPQLGVLEDRALENVRRASAGTPMLLTRIGSGDARPLWRTSWAGGYGWARAGAW